MVFIALMSIAGVLGGRNVWAETPEAIGCPDGMVLVGGTGTIGMKGQPYGVVETAHLDKVEAPERGCDDAIAATSGAMTCWVQTDEVDPVLAPAEVTLAPFCIDAHPFPGKGFEYTKDGMSAYKAAQLGVLLGSGRYGSRRLCSFSEFQAAVAGLNGNSRFVYGDRADAARCPENRTIGVDPQCANTESGVAEYGAVHSHWTWADAAFVARACAQPPCRGVGGRIIQVGDLVVAGGTARMQTRQAPLTPHTWHDHGLPNREGCEQMGWDDQPVICADLDVRYRQPPETWTDDWKRTEAAWRDFVRVARESQSMSKTLGFGLGGPVCESEKGP